MAMERSKAAVSVVAAWHARCGAASALGSLPFPMCRYLCSLARLVDCNTLLGGAHGSGVTITDDGGCVRISGGGTAVAVRGYAAGVHRWSFLAARVGECSWCGVAPKALSPTNLEGHLASWECAGFSVSGDSRGRCSTRKGALHDGVWCDMDLDVREFTDDDRVAFVLDCDAGTLAYFVNESLVVTLSFNGTLRAAVPLYPAFSNYSAEACFTDIVFDD
eukprot:TRINITY_DN2803_c0_g1_i10.p2 TRINITY_DN2803_c0_g1~~TRINITY_DN2803_c0_g1_i10.p2  ORF type:complete len:239 (+),score=70.95 TRINITY_DN2803_c0_g1_i10:62-718(+)